MMQVFCPATVAWYFNVLPTRVFLDYHDHMFINPSTCQLVELLNNQTIIWIIGHAHLTNVCFASYIDMYFILHYGVSTYIKCISKCHPWDLGVKKTATGVAKLVLDGSSVLYLVCCLVCRTWKSIIHTHVLEEHDNMILKTRSGKIWQHNNAKADKRTFKNH